MFSRWTALRAQLDSPKNETEYKKYFRENLIAFLKKEDGPNPTGKLNLPRKMMDQAAGGQVAKLSRVLDEFKFPTLPYEKMKSIVQRPNGLRKLMQEQLDEVMPLLVDKKTTSTGTRVTLQQSVIDAIGKDDYGDMQKTAGKMDEIRASIIKAKESNNGKEIGKLYERVLSMITPHTHILKQQIAQTKKDSEEKITNLEQSVIKTKLNSEVIIAGLNRELIEARRSNNENEITRLQDQIAKEGSDCKEKTDNLEQSIIKVKLNSEVIISGLNREIIKIRDSDNEGEIVKFQEQMVKEESDCKEKITNLEQSIIKAKLNSEVIIAGLNRELIKARESNNESEITRLQEQIIKEENDCKEEIAPLNDEIIKTRAESEDKKEIIRFNQEIIAAMQSNEEDIALQMMKSVLLSYGQKILDSVKVENPKVKPWGGKLSEEETLQFEQERQKQVNLQAEIMTPLESLAQAITLQGLPDAEEIMPDTELSEKVQELYGLFANIDINGDAELGLIKNKINEAVDKLEMYFEIKANDGPADLWFNNAHKLYKDALQLLKSPSKLETLAKLETSDSARKAEQAITEFKSLFDDPGAKDLGLDDTRKQINTAVRWMEMYKENPRNSFMQMAIKSYDNAVNKFLEEAPKINPTPAEVPWFKKVLRCITGNEKLFQSDDEKRYTRQIELLPQINQLMRKIDLSNQEHKADLEKPVLEEPKDEDEAHNTLT